MSHDQPSSDPSWALWWLVRGLVGCPASQGTLKFFHQVHTRLRSWLPSNSLLRRETPSSFALRSPSTLEEEEYLIINPIEPGPLVSEFNGINSSAEGTSQVLVIKPPFFPRYGTPTSTLRTSGTQLGWTLLIQFAPGMSFVLLNIIP